MVRFLLGAVMMIGALVFLGCPLRMVLRMSAGDLNAYVALIGFAGGVATGSCFLKKGFSLGRAYETKPLSGAVLPVLLAALLVIGVATVLMWQARKARQQARSAAAGTDGRIGHRCPRTEKPYVLCRKHPRCDPDEEFRPAQHYCRAVCGHDHL